MNVSLTFPWLNKTLLKPASSCDIIHEMPYGVSPFLQVIQVIVLESLPAFEQIRNEKFNVVSSFEIFRWNAALLDLIFPMFCFDNLKHWLVLILHAHCSQLRFVYNFLLLFLIYFFCNFHMIFDGSLFLRTNGYILTVWFPANFQWNRELINPYFIKYLSALIIFPNQTFLHEIIHFSPRKKKWFFYKSPYDWVIIT